MREACVEDGRRLEYGFFADFRPVSYSENLDPDSPGFNSHLGYEADLLTALETMEDAGLIFNRSAIKEWPGIWLLPATPRYDLVGGGITILKSRTRDATGATRVIFTSGHITFRQSLLVRAEDAQRYGSHDDLDDARVAVLGGSTGEHRLLQLTGVVDSEGNLAAGTVIHLGDGTRLTADGSTDYRITAAASTGNLSDRTRIEGIRGTVREVLIMSTDQEQLDALRDGRVDAVARGGLGNHEASRNSDSRFVVTALDPEVEYGAFVFDKNDRALADCVDTRINYLTDNQRIGFAEWVEDPEVFLKRARYWNASAEDDDDGCFIAATGSAHQNTLLNLLLTAFILFSVVSLRKRVWH
ncbi:MAG: transporter substrate-binding domain-containing protein [Candidatus Dadabacteria bacterium]|nr:transporter substrate-binding domain-containing protein [Candidatus Dadabacteria bacterium]MDE0477835.1 transporter substrate-binding domain-containing protein [Candidatus Dadabacteria bacterium]